MQVAFKTGEANGREIPQNFANHSRLDPAFHFFLLPVIALLWITSIVILVVIREDSISEWCF